MNRTPPKVGQVVYSLNVGNLLRRSEQKLTPMTVTKIGRKYFTCEIDHDDRSSARFHLSDWGEEAEYDSRHRLYESPQEWEDEKERNRHIAAIRAAFPTYGSVKLPLETLRGIVALLAVTNGKGVGDG